MHLPSGMRITYILPLTTCVILTKEWVPDPGGPFHAGNEDCLYHDRLSLGVLLFMLLCSDPDFSIFQK